MEKTVNSWDDIPSLGLEMEDSSQENKKTAEKRRHERIDSKVLKGLLLENLSFIPVKIATLKGVFDGHIEDLSQSGARIFVQKFFEKDESVKIGFVINSRKIIIKGIIKWVSKYETGSVAGLEFVDPGKSDVDFIAGMIHASNFNKAKATGEIK